ncbi:nucleotide sugar dehydrogenase [Candidatus Nitronereus thalassa]|uniref:Nucleotide sugar dehydrogenase n=1 Tax=Candidatus Nitronereus thalassa TaxID=3020898 RepID=A0ABU3K535_9BACT|nr:nucleotide sugar dehydrogenase [Candidatus Nitronereus thalassa]MDT7041520.1 nucleotide sugar dehydrogenase [Candidatus Nitronereus thalassa]
MLLKKIQDHTSVVGVIGLGYVGLPLAVLQAKNGYKVIGIDESEDKVDRVNQGHNYILDVKNEELTQAVESGLLVATTDFGRLKECDVVLICVPTPLTLNKEPDITAIVKVTQHIAHQSHPHMLVVLESTTYPGTTEEVIIPALTKGGLELGETLFVAFSPERVDPGNKAFKTHNTFKLVGGATPACLEVARSFYEQSIEKVFPVSSPRAAEMTKVFENVFRSVNIALVNELAVLCDRMGINVYEVIDAAATKNFGFMAFYPGPGVGGHCIPLDPYYLAWKSKEYDLHTRFIELAGEINENMPYYVMGKLQRILNEKKKCLNGAKILVLGVTYKADIEDPRESPATKVMELLQKEGACLSYADPFTPSLVIDGKQYKAVDLTADELAQCDCALILTAHSAFNYDMIVQQASLVFDTRYGTRNIQAPSKNVVLLS